MIIWKVVWIVYYLRPNFSSGKPKQLYFSWDNLLGALMSLFYCSDINVFSNDCSQWELYNIYGCSSLGATPGVSQYRSNTGGTTLLQLLLVLYACILADYSLFYPPSLFDIHVNFPEIELMLIYHSWHTFIFESADKMPFFIKVAVFIWCSFSMKLSDLQRKAENLKLLPYYLNDRCLIYKIV